jgi:anti-sigma-K factor RskA
MEHQALRELSGAYALGALSEEERRIFEAHLTFCPECAREAAELCDAAAALGGLAEMRQPPAHIRARVMAATRTDARPTGAKAITPPTWLLVAASVALVLVSGYAALLRARIAVLEADLQSARARTSAVEYQVADLRRAVSATSRVTDILSAPDLARIDLSGQPPADGATGRAYWSRSRGLIFTATNLPPLAPDRVYQLWMVTAQSKISAGLLSIDRAGRGTAVADTPPDLQPVAVAVTLEPAGGVPAPTGAIYLVGTL